LVDIDENLFSSMPTNLHGACCYSRPQCHFHRPLSTFDTKYSNAQLRRSLWNLRALMSMGLMQSRAERAHVYVVSAGINSKHSEFLDDMGNSSRVVAAYTLDDRFPADIDVRGEGTIAAGLVAGRTYGVAKAATVHSVKVFRDDSVQYSTPEEEVVKALHWILVRPTVQRVGLASGPCMLLAEEA
jgi:hypothetical protein